MLKQATHVEVNHTAGLKYVKVGAITFTVRARALIELLCGLTCVSPFQNKHTVLIMFTNESIKRSHEQSSPRRPQKHHLTHIHLKLLSLPTIHDTALLTDRPKKETQASLTKTQAKLTHQPRI